MGTAPDLGRAFGGEIRAKSVQAPLGVLEECGHHVLEGLLASYRLEEPVQRDRVDHSARTRFA